MLQDIQNNEACQEDFFQYTVSFLGTPTPDNLDKAYAYSLHCFIGLKLFLPQRMWVDSFKHIKPPPHPHAHIPHPPPHTPPHTYSPPPTKPL